MMTIVKATFLLVLAVILAAWIHGGGGSVAPANCLLISGTSSNCLLISGTTTNALLVE